MALAKVKYGESVRRKTERLGSLRRRGPHLTSQVGQVSRGGMLGVSLGWVTPLSRTSELSVTGPRTWCHQPTAKGGNLPLLTWLTPIWRLAKLCNSVWPCLGAVINDSTGSHGREDCVLRACLVSALCLRILRSLSF